MQDPTGRVIADPAYACRITVGSKGAGKTILTGIVIALLLTTSAPPTLAGEGGGRGPGGGRG